MASKLNHIDVRSEIRTSEVRQSVKFIELYFMGRSLQHISVVYRLNYQISRTFK